MSKKENLPDQAQGSRRSLGRLRNDNPPCDFAALPRCQAKAKSTGQRCGKPAMKGKRVCYIHGGRSTGAPTGNRNAFKTGLHTAAAIQEREGFRATIREWNETLDQLGFTVRETHTNGTNGGY